MAPRVRQREIGQPRELTKQDLERITPEVRLTLPAVKRFRDTHHRTARLIASGLRLQEVASRSGFSIERIYMLNIDPSFQELVDRYRKDAAAAFKSEAEEYYSLIASNALKAERQIADRLDKADEEEELLPTRELVSISRDAADRIGFGKRQTITNINADFADLLDKAIKRSGKVINQDPARHLLSPAVPPTIEQEKTVEQGHPIRRLRLA